MTTQDQFNILKQALENIYNNDDCNCSSGLLIAEGERFGICAWCTAAEALVDSKYMTTTEIFGEDEDNDDDDDPS